MLYFEIFECSFKFCSHELLIYWIYGSRIKNCMYVSEKKKKNGDATSFIQIQYSIGLLHTVKMVDELTKVLLVIKIYVF